MEIPPVKILGDDEISNDKASGVRSKVNDKTTISCLRCDYQSDKLHNFRKHYRSMHLPCKATKTLFCCDTSFPTKWDYVQHSMICHGKPKNGYNNGMRSRSSNKGDLISEPLRGHGNNYFCNNCEFTSASKYSTLRHMKVCTTDNNVSHKEGDPDIPDSTTATVSELSSSNPILHQMLQTPPMFQEEHSQSAGVLMESFVNSSNIINKPVSSLEVSSSSVSAVDSQKTGRAPSCATLSSSSATTNTKREPANPYNNLYKWPFVGPSPYSFPCHYPQPSYSAILQHQLLSAQSQTWINAHNQYRLILNSNSSSEPLKSPFQFQGHHHNTNATYSVPNFRMDFSNPNATHPVFPRPLKVKDSDNEDDIDVVS